MIVATWNVNSIRPRLGHLLQWLRDFNPDVLCLQELKTVNENFPLMEIEELGYNVAMHGQKTYNGVAILSKYPLEDVITILPGEDADLAARYIEAVITVGPQIVRVASVYVPNGQEVGSDKFEYKLRFFDRLQKHWQGLLRHGEIMVLGGDYNVAPDPIDVYNPAALEGTVCYHPKEREKMRTLFNLGLHDAFRMRHADKQQFTWWDYRGGSWQQGKGMRIDHLLLSPQALDKLVDCGIDETPRALEKPSDHTPVWCKLDIK